MNKISRFFSTQTRKFWMLWYLWDTVRFYGKDPENRRAFTNGGCQYLTLTGKQCAVGRHIPPEIARNLNQNATCDILIGTLGPLPAFTRAPNTDFWWNLQLLHDDPRNWNSQGLSSLGHQIKTEIKSNILKGNYNV